MSCDRFSPKSLTEQYVCHFMNQLYFTRSTLSILCDEQNQWGYLGIMLLGMIF